MPDGNMNVKNKYDGREYYFCLHRIAIYPKLIQHIEASTPI